jgi:hypothetical protein
MSNTDAGYTPSNGPETPSGEGTQRAPFPVARLLFSILFAFIGWFAFQVAIVVSIIHWILIAVNRDPHPEFRQFVRAVVQYVAQVLGYVAWIHDDKPFPFGPLPRGE